MSSRSDSVDDGLLERLAALLDVRLATGSTSGPDDDRADLALLRSIASGDADPRDPQVREVLDDLAVLSRLRRDDPALSRAANTAETMAVADILHLLAVGDDGPGGSDRDPVVDPVPDDDLGATSATTGRRGVGVSHPGGGSVDEWRHEMRQLFLASPVSDAELAAELHQRGFDVPPQTVLNVPENPRVAEIVVDLLGGRWVEDDFRTLYEAARRERDPDTAPAVQRHFSGLAGADSVDVATIGALIQAPVRDVPRVLGRKQLINQLIEGLEEPKRPTQVLLGASGYGKSTVALATGRGAQKRRIVPLWVPAPDVDSLVDGLQQAAIWIGSTSVDVDAALADHGDRRIARLWELLDASAVRWLLVLDDAGPEAVGHPGWVHRSPTGTTIVTTRYGDPVTWGPDTIVTGVGILAEEDGARLVLDRISVTGSRVAGGVEGHARHLSRLLAGMPLALTSVGRVLASRAGSQTLSELVERLEPTAAATAVATTYRICLQSLDGVDRVPARHLLRLIASFAPAEPLPVHVLDGAVERTWRGHDGLAMLVRAGLVEKLPTHRTEKLPPHRQEPPCVRLHPAVAEHTRRDDAFSVEAAAGIDLRAIALLGTELNRLDAAAPAAWLRIRRLEPHVAEVVESPALTSEEQQAAGFHLAERAAAALIHSGSQQAAATLLHRAFHRFDRVPVDHPVRLDARHTRARLLTLDGKGELLAVERALTGVLADKLRVLGEDDPSTLVTADTLSWVIAEQGRLPGARERFAHILERREQVLGEGHRDTLTTRHRLAWVDAQLGREEAVVAEFEDILRLRTTLLGPEHMDVYATRYRLAWVLNRIGRYAAAEGQYRKLQRDMEAAVGALHPMTLIVRNRHAWTLASLHRFRESAAVYRLLRADQEKVLGVRHPRVSRSRMGHARVLVEEGRVAEAIPEFRAVADTSREQLGDDHPQTLKARTWLAYALMKSGRAAAADRGLRAVLTDRLRVLGPRHPETLRTRYLLGRALIVRGWLAEAEEELAALLDEERRLPLDDRNRLPVRHALARLAGLRGRYAECEAGLTAVAAEQAAVLGADHRRSMVTRDDLSWVMGRAGRADDGLVTCRAVLADRQRALGPGHPHTLTSRYREAWLLALLERDDESRGLLDPLLLTLREVHGDEHPDTLRCRAELVRLARRRGELASAAEEAERLVADQTRVQGADAVETLRAREELGLASLARGADAPGRAVLEGVLDDRVRVLGEDHPDTVRSRAALG